jgi:GNAT superfamily N-acetyltransferase
MVIREARVGDAPAMGRLMVTTWLAAHRRHIPLSAWERRLNQWTPEVSASGWERHLRERDVSPDQTRACYFVAEDHRGTIIGVAAGAVSDADPTGTVGDVGSLYVQPDHQNRGIGRRLVQKLAACLADKGIRSLNIGVLTTNIDARRFYELLGGEDIGERLFDEDGVLLPERIYAWPDITSLVEMRQGMSE